VISSNLASRQEGCLLLLIFSCVFALLSFINDFDLALSFFLLSCTVFYAIASSIIVSKRFKVNPIMHGNFLAVCTLTLIFLITPSFRFLFDLDLPTVFARRDWESHYPNMNLLVSSAILALKSGEKFRKHEFASDLKRQKIASFKLSKRDLHIIFLYSLVVVFVLALYYGAWISSQGGVSRVLFGTRALRRSIEVDLGNGYALDSLFGIFGVFTFWYLVFLNRNMKKARYPLIFCSILLIPSLATGNRFFTIYYTMVLILIFLASGRNIRKRFIVFSLVILVFVVVVPREYRGLVERPSPTKLLKLLSQENLTKTFSGEDLAMAPGFAILLANNEFSKTKLQGRSYLHIISKPIPRSIWEGKPNPISQRIMAENFPEVSRSTGFAFSALCEPYLNFGPPGVILFFFLLGVFWQGLFRLSVVENTTIGIYLNSWIAPFAIYLMRGDLSVDIQRCAFPLIVGLMPVLLFKFFHRKSLS